jgi:hypothetical protein
MMRKMAVAVFVIGACVAVAAQTPANAPKTYDPASEVTLGGMITGVVATTAADGTVGVHLNLATARKEVVKVHLGPAMFIGMNDGFFLAEDQVEVTGAFVSHDGQTALWARTITKNGKTLTLRNADGVPRWKLATADDPDGCGVSHGPVRY